MVVNSIEWLRFLGDILPILLNQIDNYVVHLEHHLKQITKY